VKNDTQDRSDTIKMGKPMQMRSIIALFALLVFLCLAVGGSVYFHSVRASLLHDMVGDANDDVQDFANKIAISLSESQKISAALAGLKELTAALMMKNPGTIRQANAILDHFQSTLQADVCYLLDHNGYAIASSNRNTPQSFVGKHYAFRPFFQDAISGTPAIYPALGVVTKKRGLFYSYPVYGEGLKQPLGVLVIKSSTDSIEKEIHMRHEGIMLLVDPHGIVFISNRPEWSYHSLWRIPREELSAVMATQQFGEGPIEWIGMEKKDAYVIDNKGKQYIIYQKKIANLPGWTASYLLDRAILQQKISVEFFRKFGPFLLIFCIIIALAGLFLYRKASQEIHRRKLADEDQTRSLSLLQATLESTTDGILVVNSAGEIISFNARFVEMWRLPDDMLSSGDDRQALEFVLDKLRDPQGFLNKVEDLYSHPEEESFDVLEFKDGRIFERYSRPQRMRDDIVGRVWSFRDVTERKIAYEALRENERKYRELVENANSIILRCSPSGEIIFLNEFGCKFFGYRDGEINGCKMVGTITPENESTGQDRHHRMESICENPAAFEQNVNEYMLRDGRRAWIAWTNKAVCDVEGNLVEVLRIGTDLTERKMAEEALRVAEKKFRDLLEGIQLIAILLDRDGNITFCNDYLLNMTGWKKEELLGENWLELFIPHNEREEIKQVFASVITGEKHYLHHENVILARDGREHLITWNNTALHDLGGKITGTASIGIDITEKKHLEAQLRQSQKMEAVGQLAGGIAHDFNNIISSIVGYAYLLQTKMSVDDPSKDDVEQILESAHRAAEVTHSLLAFSKKQNINPKPVLITDVVKRFQKLLSRFIGEDIAISTALSCNEAKCLLDAAQIEQVLMNLANNARDAMPHGGRLTISTDCVKLDESFIRIHGYGKLGEYALISVSDTGLGMSPETSAKIFEPFFTTKETGKGTGLGLAMAYGIIKQHEGYINVYSELGNGTTFNIYLPLVESKVEWKAEVVVKPIESWPSGGTETILVTEDDEKLRKLSETILKQQGYNIILAQNGEEAIGKFVENKDIIHLVLLDMIMPKKSGKEVYDEIKRIKPDMKVIFVSGYTADRMGKDILTEKNVNFIFKPVSPKDLLRKIREMLDN
jgi:PAS domain S-box-containing protein